MKSRLTLTIDPKVMHRAKVFARSRNQSLSSLVEVLLEDATGNQGREESGETFSRRWAGKLKITPRDEERYRHLSKKYGLE
jgi:hypothetical protein